MGHVLGDPSPSQQHGPSIPGGVLTITFLHLLSLHFYRVSNLTHLNTHWGSCII